MRAILNGINRYCVPKALNGIFTDIACLPALGVLVFVLSTDIACLPALYSNITGNRLSYNEHERLYIKLAS